MLLEEIVKGLTPFRVFKRQLVTFVRSALLDQRLWLIIGHLDETYKREPKGLDKKKMIQDGLKTFQQCADDIVFDLIDQTLGRGHAQRDSHQV